MSESDVSALSDASERFFGQKLASLGERERRVLKTAAHGRTLSTDTSAAFDKGQSFGQRLADRVAAVGGSWGFIIGFLVFLAVWAGINVVLSKAAFDPYPFIFLNLMLSMLAAIQAPIIMMSQNRQSAKDRAAAEHDYEVNLKSEIEIMALQQKMDQLRADQIKALLEKQEEQLEMLRRLLEARTKP